MVIVRPINRLPLPWWVTGLILGVLVAAPRTDAQNNRYGGFTSRVDAYGNAEVGYDDRRVLEVYQNQAQRNALERYQEFGRRPERRGDYAPFAFPSDLFFTARPSRALYARPATALTSADERIFKRYGGFGVRLGERYGGDIDSILSRRNELLRATANNAPVRRALMQHGGGDLIPQRLRATPFFPGSRPAETEEVVPPPAPVESGPESAAPGPSVAPAPSNASEAVQTQVTLTERLESYALASKTSALNEAWNWFQAGEFRRAIRAFDAAAAIDRKDLEPQVGRFFCYAVLSSYGSALTELRYVAQRAPQPFVHTIPVRDRFVSEGLARDFTLQMQLQAQAAGDAPVLVAAHAFALWYLGQHDEAQRVLGGVERGLSGTVFREWPARLREARASAPAPPESRAAGP